MPRRWPTASKAFAVLAIVLGAASFSIVRAYAARLEALRPALGTSVHVVVAAVELQRGTMLTAPSLRIASMPATFVPAGAFDSAAALEGRTLLTDVAAGEILTRTRVADRGSGPVAALVPPGLRAASVQSGLPSGAVRPGDRVDVLATYGGDRPHTETVASGLEVVLVMRGASAGGTPLAGADSASSPSLMVLVTSEDAERLAYARAFAELSVSVQGQPASPMA